MASGFRLGATLVIVCLGFVVAGCRGMTSDRPPIHPNPNMDNQPKYMPQASSGFFADGATMRLPVEGTVARGELRDPALVTGRDQAGALLAANPIAGEGLLARGEERYGIYCTPCHGGDGSGRGVLYERAQIEATDLLSEHIVALPDGQIFEVITDGVGLMSGYGYAIPVEDRWAIVAHVRAMQQSGVVSSHPDSDEEAAE